MEGREDLRALLWEGSGFGFFLYDLSLGGQDEAEGRPGSLGFDEDLEEA